MSDKSRLESLEKQVVAQNRLLRELVKSLEEAAEELSALDDKIEQEHSNLFDLEEAFNSHIHGDNGLPVTKEPDS